MKNFLIPSIVSASFLVSCGVKDSKSSLKDAWSQDNSPELISGLAYESDFYKLETKGRLATPGWSDSYWPTYQGGIGYRWQVRDYGFTVANEEKLSQMDLSKLSPAEKLDLLNGSLDFPMLLSERSRTRILKTVKTSSEYDKDYKIPAWEGLCHGWAPAALNYSEPVKSVEIETQAGKVTFYPSDIKALLMYHQQYNNPVRKSYFQVADRCYDSFKDFDEQLAKGTITEAEWLEKRNSTSCKDINPGSLHLILANEIGIKKEGFIIDITRDAEVWNQPVNGYQTQIVGETTQVSEGSADGTVKEVHVITTVEYTQEVDASRDPAGAYEKKAVYDYVLELNKDNQIIGGHWSSEKGDRPDFLWRQGKAEFVGYFGSFQEVYEKSIQ